MNHDFDFDDGYMPEPDGSELACLTCHRHARLVEVSGTGRHVYTVEHEPDCPVEQAEALLDQYPDGPPDVEEE
ncbi:MAG: hypothetical protein ABIJ75_07170 [Actinomycetota bacterium]